MATTTTTVTINAASTAMSDKGESLDAAWEEACLAFKEAAGINLKSSKVPSADDIREKFDKKRAKDAEDHVKINKAKDAFAKTVNLVGKVGAVAAQGASMVFGSPASIAQGALSIFIEAGLQYRNIFHNIEDILVRIVVVFERFQVYVENQNELPVQMIRVANKLLVAVVNICGLCYKTLKRNKLKTFLDIALFSNDKGVQAQLARLTALEAEESQMKGTLSLVAAESTKRSVATGFAQTSEGLGKISANMQRMEAADKAEKDLKELRETLSIPKDNNSHEEYRRYLDRLSERANSCEWLKEDTVYQSWVRDRGEQKPVLVLSGGEGFGKSFTATAIINDLQDRFPQRQQTADRTSVAYFYLTRGGKEGAIASVSEVLRMLIWQLAGNDLFYRKTVVSISKQLHQLGSTQELWNQFFIDCSEEEATFFLVIDGIQELEEKEQDLLVELVKTLAKPQAKRSIKLLLPSRTSFTETLKSKCPGHLAVLDLAERSQDDIKAHTAAEVDKMTIFQKQTEKVQRLKQEVCDGVVEAVNGSFLYADYLLREISGKYDPQEVMAIVARAKESGGNLTDSITDVIKHCNQTLSAKDLQDLNTLLLWVIYGEWGFDLGELEAIIYLQRGEPSLKPLYNQIKENFSAFFTISPDENDQYSIVNLKSDSIADYFRHLSEEQNSASSASAKALSKGEIKLVQNFIMKLCEQDTYERLGLDAFFEQKLSETDTTIFVDCQNAHALMIIDCMKALVGGVEDSEMVNMRNYAGRHLPSHLKQLDLDAIDPKYKAEIGPLLVQLFKSQEGIKQSYTAPWVNLWTYNDDLTKEVVRLMRSSVVMKKVMAAGGDDAKWVTSILESQTHWIDLLRPTAMYSIHGWMETTAASNTRLFFLSILGIYNKVEHFNDPQNCERLDDAPSADEVPIKVIKEVFEWAKTWVDLDYSAVDSIRNLGVTFRECDHLDEGIELLKQALEISNDSLKAHANLARAYEIRSQKKTSREWDNALHHGSIVVDATASGKSLFFDGDAQIELYWHRRYMGGWHRKLQQYDEAVTIYRTVLEEDPGDFATILDLAIALCEQEQYTDVVTYLTSLEEKFEADSQLPSFSALLDSFAYNDEYNARIVRAFKHAGEIDKAKQLYEKAIKDAWKPANEHTPDSIQTYVTAMYNLAVIYHHHPADKQESSKAIKLWEDVLHVEGPLRTLGYPKYRSKKRLSLVYMALAVEAGRDTPIANDMVAKIQNLGVSSSEGDDEDGYGISKAVIRSLVGRYFSTVGDKEQAQAFLKQNVEVGIKLLSDDDPENDFQGWRKLGDAFLDFGDTKNAIASWTMIVPTQGVEHFERRTASLSSDTANSDTNGDGSPEVQVNGATHDDSDDVNGDDLPIRPKLQRTNTSQLERKLQGPLTYQCDGDCETEWTYANDIWVCQECLDVQFDEACLTRLRTGDLPKNICSPTHHFMHVPAFDPAWLDRVRRDCALIDEEEVPVKDWLASIKKEWGIVDEVPEESTESGEII